MGKVSIIVGTQWGDEGKGKWVDALAKNSDIIARYQGGNNAGHTIYHQGKRFVLHHLPGEPLKRLRHRTAFWHGGGSSSALARDSRC